MAATSNKIARELISKELKLILPRTSQTTNQSLHLIHHIKTTNKQFLSSKLVNANPDNMAMKNNSLNLQPSMLQSRTNGELNIPFKFNSTLELKKKIPKVLGMLYMKNLLSSNNNIGSQSSRFYSTRSSFDFVSRGLRTSICDQGKKKKCCPKKKKKKKKKCKLRKCPKWVLWNCPKIKKRPCEKPYIDPCCKKPMAPYPSYSESCAKRLPDDPSECMKCPWKRCGGTLNIRTPHQRAHRKKYHTQTRSYSTISNYPLYQKSLPLVQITDVKLPPVFTDKKMFESKKESLTQLLSKLQHEKKIQNQRPNWVTAYKLYTEKYDIDILGDSNEFDYNKNFMKCVANVPLELAKEHDKGHPPPCKHWRKKSKICPKPRKCKKKTRKQRDLKYPVFKRALEPWSEKDKGHGERAPDKYW